MKKNNKGFTIIEMVVVIAIVAILATVIFSYLSLIFSTQNKEAAYAISEMMEQTRSYAMNGRPSAELVISFESDDKYYAVIQMDDEGTTKEISSKELLGDEELGIKVGADEVKTSNVTIGFETDGSVEVPSALAEITLTGYKVEVVSTTGYIDVVKN